MSITVIIVVLTGLISYSAFNRDRLFFNLSHWPAREFQYKEFYRLVTSGFVHGDWIHLLVNMFVLYSFGEFIEYHFKMYFGPTLGVVYFVAVYLLTIISASLPSYFGKRNLPNYMAVGASGGVSGIVFIFILLYPWEYLYLYALIPIPGIVAGVLYLWYSSYASRHSNDRIDHEAHFYGALFGVLFTLLLRPSLAGDFVRSLINDFPL